MFENLTFMNMIKNLTFMKMIENLTFMNMIENLTFMQMIENLTFRKIIENLTFVKSDCYYQSKTPGCETTIFSSITGEVGALANSQFRVNSFLSIVLYCDWYWY